MSNLIEEMISHLMGELARLEAGNQTSRVEKCLKDWEAMHQLYGEACHRAKIPNKAKKQSFHAIWASVVSRYHGSRGEQEVEDDKSDSGSTSSAVDRAQYSPSRSLNGNLTDRVNSRIDFNPQPNARKTIVITEDDSKAQQTKERSSTVGRSGHSLKHTWHWSLVD